MAETSDRPLPSSTSFEKGSQRPRFVLDPKAVEYLSSIVESYPIDIRGLSTEDLYFKSGQASLARDLLILAHKFGDTNGK